jgi:hypothetical protein
MPVTQVHTALGSWQIALKPDCPRDVLDAVQELGHIAIVAGRIDPRAYGDNLLTAARYVGVVRSKTFSDDARTRADMVQIGGSGLEFWLGDEDDKGAVIESPFAFISASFPTAIRGLLPSSGAITEGTLYSVAGTYSGVHQWQTPRKAIQYVCDTMSTTAVPVSWRVNGNGTLDAGPESNLFVTTPACAIVKRGAGQDMNLLALPGQLNLAEDVQDFTTRVVLLAQGEGASIATGSANINPALNPYKDLHGNSVAFTRMVSESGTSQTNAIVRAQLALSQFTGPHHALTLTAADYDIAGSFIPGDYVWTYDPDKGLVDTANEINFRGQRLNPLKLQVTETTWPVTAGHTVGYRSAAGAWTDLTDYVTFEPDGTTTVVVGNFERQLTNSSTEPVGSRPTADTSIPGVPTFITPFSGAAYLDNRGFTRARLITAWNAPNNTDGSTVLDGDHYELRWAVDTDLIYPATWSQLSQVRWEDLQQWRQPFAAPTGQWQYMNVAWGTTTAQLLDLAPGIGYDLQIRAVDRAGNIGAWSPTTTIVATADNIPPSTPAPPSVAASRIALQITHTLGRASGGTYNLEADLHHLEIHVEYEPYFTPSPTTLKAKVSATAGMIQAQVPVVTTVQVEETSARYVRVIAVDIAGNKSAPSDAATATALLIDDAHISDLTVSKVTAGTINADWIVGARIKTADTGARVELNSAGLQAFNAAGTQTVDIASATGNVSIIGTFATGIAGSNRLVVNPVGVGQPEIRCYTDYSATDYSSIGAFASGFVPGLLFQSSAENAGATVLSLDDSSAYIGYNTGFGHSLAIGATDTRLQTNNKGYWIVNDTYTQIGFDITEGSASSSMLKFHDTGLVRLVGKFNNYVAASSKDAVFTGSVSISGVSGVSLTYGATMASTMVPLVTLVDSGAAKSTQISASSTTGFTASFSASASGAVNIWSYRV